MSSNGDNFSPDEIVEQEILTRLKENLLIDDEIFARLEGKLAKGSLKASDWNFLFDDAFDQAKRGSGCA